MREPSVRPIDLLGIDPMDFDASRRLDDVCYDGLTFARLVALLPAFAFRADRGTVIACKATRRPLGLSANAFPADRPTRRRGLTGCFAEPLL